MELSNFIVEMQSMRGAIEKMNHLQRYDSVFFRELMDAIFNPMRHFNVSVQRQNFRFSGDVDLSEKEDELRELLLKCEVSESSQKNKMEVLEFAKDLNKGSQKFLQGVINKKPKIGVGQKTILKVFPNLFPAFNPQKGHLYKPEKDYGVSTWYATPKYNGIRAVCLYRNSMWRLHTYVGHEIHTCEHIIPDLETLRKKYGYTMIDGEVYNHSLTYNQIERAILTSSNAQAGIEAGIYLNAFTAGQEPDFTAERCENFVPKLPNFEGEWALMIRAIEVSTPEEIHQFYIGCIELGYEGAVLRNPDNPYDFRKSNAMVKVKKDCFGDLDISDCVVTEVITGEIPFAAEAGGYEYRTSMTALRVIQPDGLDCKVGTGFSQEFRENVYHGRTDIVDRVIEVKHEGWGDRGRMIFPRFKLLRHYKDKVA